MRLMCASVLLAVGSVAPLATAQYTYQLRLIADGQVGSPGGPSAATTYRIGGDLTNVIATRVGFWLQGRVAQTTGQNWGIVRATSPAGGASMITLSDPTHQTSLWRGPVNSASTLFGRGYGYRTTGADTGTTDTTPNSAPFPGTTGNENGGLDDGGTGAGPGAISRIYGFDCSVGTFRSDADFDHDGDVDDNGDGVPENPWGVNGTSHPADVDGAPYPSDGTFAPWANLYRIVLDINLPWRYRAITLNASAVLSGAERADPISLGSATYEMRPSPGQLVTAPAFTWSYIPTPGITCWGVSVLGWGALRRRR